MNVLSIVKHGYCLAIGAIGGLLLTLWGDWNVALTILSVSMLIDIVTGVLVACVFGESPKSLYGGLSSKSFARGIIKKVGVFVVIWVGHGLDVMLNTDYIRNATIVAFIAAEFISVLENCALMGVPIPAFILRMIDVLKGEGEKELTWDEYKKNPEKYQTDETGRVTVIAYSEYEDGNPIGEPVEQPVEDQDE